MSDFDVWVVFVCGYEVCIVVVMMVVVRVMVVVVMFMFLLSSYGEKVNWVVWLRRYLVEIEGCVC